MSKNQKECGIQLGTQTLIADLTLGLMGEDDFHAKVESILAQVGEHVQVSRVYIFEDDEDGLTTSNTFEWCNTGIAPQQEELQGIPYSLIPSWAKELREKGRIFSEDIATLPEDIHAVLAPQNILSIVVYPLVIDGGIRGFIGFDECLCPRQWNDEELDLLKTISGVLSTAFSREYSRKRLNASEANYRSLFNAIDDLMFVLDENGRIAQVNTAVSEKLGYTPDELQQMHVLDLHPKEFHDEARETVGAMARGERDSCAIPLCRKNGGHMPVETRIWHGIWNGRPSIFGISKDRSKEAALLEKFNKLFDYNPSLMAVASLPERTLTHVNKAFLNKLGYSYDEVIGRTSAELQLINSPEKRRVVADSIAQNQEIHNLELEARAKDGRILHGLYSGVIINDQAGKSYLSVMADISKQIELQRELEAERRKIENILEGTNAGTWEWNVQTGEARFNERWAEIVGYTLAELQPISIDTWMGLAHPDDLPRSQKKLEEHFAGKSPYYSCELRMNHKSGELVWVRDHGRVAERDAEGKPLIMYGTHIDITELKQNEERIREISIRDPLTGLFNRRHCLETMETLISKCARGTSSMAVALLDLDFFKAVNDTYGHPAGDEVLCSLADLLRQNIRPFDLACRYGGEEFLLIFQDASFDQAHNAIKRIHDKFRDMRWEFQGQTVRLTFSCGLVHSGEFPCSGLSTEALIKCADDRLYEAKKAGRDTIIT